MLRFLTGSEAQTIELGEALGHVLRAGDIVMLDGELGAGKTRLVRGIARGVGVDESLVASPTYVIAHEYPPTRPLAPALVHVDAYRLSGPDELESIGWDRLLDQARVVVVEWAGRIESALAKESSRARVHIDSVFEFTDSPEHSSRTGRHAPEPLAPTSRVIRLECPESWELRPGWNRLASLADTSGAHGASDAPGAQRCPACGGPVGLASPYHPFCRERCRLADLGRWFSGAYQVSRPLGEDDLGDADPDAHGGRVAPG